MPFLNKASKKFIQAKTGTFLYYVQAVDSTLPMALSTITAQQAKPINMTMAEVEEFIDYCAMHEDAVITYQASNMS